MNHVDVKHCSKCHNPTIVIDSRDEFNHVRRRRECVNCGYRFSTIEILKAEFDKMNKSLKIIKESVDGA